MVMTYLTHQEWRSITVGGSAAGAGFNSHGRKAVVCSPQDEIEARRADISLRINAAPAALNY
jgi:hypothetical protein